MIFDFVLTDEITRKRILDYVKPSYNSSFSYQNLNLAYGVVDEEWKFFLTRSYYISQNIKRSDDRFDDYEFVVVTDQSVFKACCQIGLEIYDSSIEVSEGFEQYLEIVREAIVFYKDYSKQDAFENLLKRTNPEFSLFKLEQECKNQILDSIKFSAAIRSKEDAKQLFLKHKCSSRFLRDQYSSQTVQDYEKHIEEQTEFEWKSKEYIRILTEITEGKAANPIRNLIDAKRLLEQGVSDIGQAHFTEALATIFIIHTVSENSFDFLGSCLSMYEKIFADQIEMILPVLEMADFYIKKNYPRFYKSTGGYRPIELYNRHAKILYDIISDMKM